MIIKDFPYYGCEDDEKFKFYIKKVIGGEYECSVDSLGANPIILDLGANIGSFAYWAAKRYPGSHIVSFEPHTKNCQNYLKKMRDSNIQPWFYTIVQAAVYPTDSETITLYESAVNDGMHSVSETMTNTEDPIGFQAKVIHPKSLPDAQLLKLDTEGCEVQILEEYLKSRTFRPFVISFEFHSMFDLTTLDELLEKDYILCSGKIVSPNLGTLNYVHKDLVEASLR